MDANFPMVAKCLRGQTGIVGDLEIEQTLCQIPMNAITRWTFFCFYIWCFIVFVINILSTLYVIAIAVFPCLRKHHLVQLSIAVSPLQIDMARNMVSETP
jgi:Innexin